MIANFAFTTFLGYPLIMYGGILTLLSLLTTGTLGYLIHKGHRIPFKIHPTIAVITIILALIHALFGLAFFFKF